MARPKDGERRRALLEVAARVVGTKGTGASTAEIAREAGVSSGSVFTYFEGKAHLLNEVYRELSREKITVAMEGIPWTGTERVQCYRMWMNWVEWAGGNREKRRALALLEKGHEVTVVSRKVVRVKGERLRTLMLMAASSGPLRDLPMGFLWELSVSMMEATVDFMERDPARAARCCEEGFEAMWRMIA